MGWHINNTVNEVVLTKEQAEKVYAVMIETGLDTIESDDEPFEWHFGGSGHTYKFTFLSDHMEWMDWISRAAPEFFAVMEEIKANGDICFSSEEGDDAGSYWGHRFKNGKYIELVGKYTYSEVPSASTGEPQKLKRANWKDLSKLGLVRRINTEILHPLGYAVFYDSDTGISEGAFISDDGVWEYADKKDEK